MTVAPRQRRQIEAQESVTANIRALMGRHRVTQTQLAGALGISLPGMSDRLSNKTNLTIREAIRIAEFFDVPLAELVSTSSNGRVA